MGERKPLTVSTLFTTSLLVIDLATRLPAALTAGPQGSDQVGGKVPAPLRGQFPTGPQL